VTGREIPAPTVSSCPTFRKDGTTRGQDEVRARPGT